MVEEKRKAGTKLHAMDGFECGSRKLRFVVASLVDDLARMFMGRKIILQHVRQLRVARVLFGLTLQFS